MFPQLNIFDLEISVYFLSLSLIFTLAVPIIIKRALRVGVSPVQALDLYLFVLIGAFLGSRGMYVLYQEPEFYFKNPLQVISFWNGGYIFFGGFIGAVVSGLFFCKGKKQPPEKWLNFSIPILSLGYAVGRWACFLSGCCYGKDLNAWWAVFMHQTYRHPTQIYASLMEFTILGILILVEKRKGFQAFLALPIWMFLHGLARIIMEHFRADPRGAEFYGMSVSTNISIVLVVLGAVLLLKKLKAGRHILED